MIKKIMFALFIIPIISIVWYYNHDIQQINHILRLENAELSIKNRYCESDKDMLMNQTYELIEQINFLRSQFNSVAQISEIVVLPENIRISDYNISWIDVCGFNQSNNGDIIMDDAGAFLCAGWTNGNGTIFIKNNRSVSEIIETCNHEVLHNIVGMSNLTEEEEVVERIDDIVMSKECAILEVELRRGELK